MNKELNYPLAIRKSKIAGKGAFALQPIPAKRKLGNMGGVIISYKEAQKRVKKQPGNVLIKFGLIFYYPGRQGLR